MNDYVIIFCFLLPGAALLILGIYNAAKIYRLKEIASFPLMQDVKTLNFPKAGNYCLIVAGGNKVNQLPLRIVSQATGRGIDAYSVVPTPRSFKKGKIEVSYCRFFIEQAGQYEIKVTDYERVVVKRTYPGLLRLIGNTTISTAGLKLIIEEHASGFTRATAIIGTIIGSLLIIFGTIFLLNNHGVISPSKSEITTTTYTI